MRFRLEGNGGRERSAAATDLMILAILPWLVWGGHTGCEGAIGGGAEGNQRAAAAYSGPGFHPVTAFRRLDTRDENRRLGAEATRCLRVAGQDDIPSSAKAVAINLVAVGPTGRGFLTAYPDGQARPETSTLNHGPGQTAANGAIVGVGDGGKICVFALVATHIVIDVTGYFEGSAAFAPVGPYRRLDTREDGGRKPAASDSTLCLAVAGERDRGVPPSAKAVAINLTAVAPTGPGFLTAYPAGQTRPETSTVNHAAGQTVANGAIVGVGDDGKICVYVKTKAHLVIDVTGYFTPSSDYTPVSPYRRLDTRGGSQPVAGSTRCYKVAGKNDVPAAARAVAVNLTAVGPAGPGYLLARPAGKAQIETSVLNYAQDGTRANNAMVEPGVDGKICIFTLETTHYILDVVGYWPGQAVAPLDHPHTFNVSNSVGFRNALETACCGDAIKIAPSAVIDLTGHRELAVPGNVTITGGRAGATKGALIRSRQTSVLPNYKTWNLLSTSGPNVVLRGVRLQGPDGTVGSTTGFMAGGIAARHDGVLIENSELFNWPARAIYVSGEGVVVRNNYIHDNIRAGRGYGLNVGAVTTATVIEHNTFARNRHSIAGGGDGSYIVRHNRFVDGDPAGGMHALIDMHGVNEHKLDNSTMQAGVRIHIHNNDFEFRGTAGHQAYVGIRGIPADVAIVENNCVARTDGRWVVQAIMTAHPQPVAGKSCYEKWGTFLCHTPAYGSAMQKIVVRENHLGKPSGCRGSLDTAALSYSKAESAAPESAPAESEPPPPAPSPAPAPAAGGPGDACPCSGSALCVEGLCRAPCAAPTDACEAGGNCPASQACVPFSATEGVCLPAVKAGGACGGDKHCAVGHVCATVNNGPTICQPTCTNPSGKCQDGSTCLAAFDGCNFCGG